MKLHYKYKLKFVISWHSIETNQNLLEGPLINA